MINKICSQCKKLLPTTAFDFANKSTGKKHSECKECRGKQEKVYYENHREDRISYAMANGRKRMVRNRLVIIEYLKSHPCVDCGEGDFRILEFDHRDPASKLLAIPRLVGGRYSIKTIMTEIAKCDVRCANCHRRRTVEQLSWYKNLGVGKA